MHCVYLGQRCSSSHTPIASAISLARAWKNRRHEGNLKQMVDLATWTGMFAFAATTGIITAVLNQTFGIGRDVWAAHIKRRSEAGYLALRLAVILEAYAYSCASFIADNANAQHPSDEPYPAWNTRLPDLPPFPDEVKEGWHSIDLKLAARALDLPNLRAGSQGMINSTSEFNAYELEHELGEHAGKRGQEAWALAKDLRNRYDLPAFAPVWDFTEYLESALREAKTAKEERARLQAAGMQQLDASA